MGLHLVHRYIVESLTVTRAFRKIFLFDSILFIFECDGGTLWGKLTTHTLKVWREMCFVKPIPIYDTFIFLVKRCRLQHVVTTPGALLYSTDPRRHDHRTHSTGTVTIMSVTIPPRWRTAISGRSRCIGFWAMHGEMTS